MVIEGNQSLDLSCMLRNLTDKDIPENMRNSFSMRRRRHSNRKAQKDIDGIQSTTYFFSSFLIRLYFLPGWFESTQCVISLRIIRLCLDIHSRSATAFDELKKHLIGMSKSCKVDLMISSFFGVAERQKDFNWTRNNALAALSLTKCRYRKSEISQSWRCIPDHWARKRWRNSPRL